jgi:hypothetical protein
MSAAGPRPRRLGDLRLECAVAIAADLISNTRRDPRYLFFADRPLFSVTLPRDKIYLYLTFQIDDQRRAALILSSIADPGQRSFSPSLSNGTA